jgi:arylsulfatase A-like enzyme
MLVAAGCSPPQQAVLVTIDSLRDDHVGVSSREAPLTPHLDRLGADGVRFGDALASATTTLASHASMLTGLRPQRHGIHANEGTLGGSIPMVGELLRLQGVRTGAVVSSFVLRSEGGLARGFETYDESFDGRELTRGGQRVKSAATTTRVALDWLARHRGDRLFLWVHYFPPHGPYTPPEQYRLEREKGESGDRPERLEFSSRNYERGRIPTYQRLEDLHEAEAYRARYEAHIRYVDDHVGRLLDGMRQLGIYQRALIIATSDHGESLGEHGWYFCHGNLVYGEQALVPLIVKWPGRRDRAGTTCSAPVELVDIAPTILAHFGLRAVEPGEGVDLAELLADPAIAAERLRLTQSTDAEISAAVLGGWKLTRRQGPARLVDEQQPRQELFRIDRDPDESEDLSLQHPEVVAALAARLPRGRAPSQGPDLSAETIERLRAMGYVE